MQDSSHARTLQQTENDIRSDVITKVASFKDLKKAWTDGAAHIEVTSHLDATNFPLIEAEMNNEVFQHLLPMQQPSTRSVRVCCASCVCRACTRSAEVATLHGGGLSRRDAFSHSFPGRPSSNGFGTKHEPCRMCFFATLCADSHDMVLCTYVRPTAAVPLAPGAYVRRRAGAGTARARAHTHCGTLPRHSCAEWPSPV